MKKAVVICIMILCLVLLLVACGQVEPNITFMVDGEVYAVKSIKEIDSVEEPKKEGYVFAGWFLDNDNWQEPLVAEDVKADCTVYAMFKKAVLTFVFECDDKYDIKKNMSVVYGDTINLPLIESSQNFIGWIDENGCGPFKKVVASANMKFKPIFGSLDRIYIDTNDAPILDKENYVPATFTMLDENGDVVNEFKDLKTGIRLRGNSTMGNSKKPYRLKFEKKQALLGDTKYKSWVLLADSNDPTMMKNYSAHYIASQMQGIKVQIRTKHVQVFLNGEERGVYLLTDQVQEQPEGSVGRVPIEIDEDELATMTEVPFLLEKDWYPEGEENLNWFKYQNGENIYNIQIKYPDEPTQEQFNFIYNIYDTACKLFNELDNAAEEEKINIRSRIEEKVDIDSVIDYCLILQIMHELDNGGSFYMYYDMNKLKFGPIWDYDAAFTIAYGYEGRFNKGYEATNRELNIEHDWYRKMRKDTIYNNLICKRFDEYGKNAMTNLINHLDNYIDKMYYDAMRNIILWSDIDKYDCGDVAFAKYYKNYGEYSEAKTYVITWFEKRLEFLTELYKIS